MIEKLCRTFVAIWASVFFIAGANPSIAKSTAAAVAVPENVYEFDSVVEGAVIIHEFQIENNGDGMLKIKKIETGCGCTTAEYSDEIEPSSTGRVVVRADTDGYGGAQFHQKITVHTDHPIFEKLVLEIVGQVEKFAEVSPRSLMMKGSVKDDLVGQVRIVPAPPFDFKIQGAETVDLDNSVDVSIDKDREGYMVTVKNIQKNPGVYVGKILLKTDSKEKQEIEIPLLMGLRP